MTANSEFSFRIVDGDDYKSRYLIYEEQGHKLSVYLEMAGGWKFDWTACDTEFNEWTEPKGGLISATKRLEIMSRLAEWSKKEKVSIDIGPPILKEELIKDYEQKGWKVERRADGSVIVIPPKKDYIARIFNLFKRKIK